MSHTFEPLFYDATRKDAPCHECGEPRSHQNHATHKTLLAAKQTLCDAAVHFALIAETEPCISGRYDAAMERLHTAAKDYTECSLRVGLTNQERIG